MLIRTLDVFTIKMEKEKLGKDEKSIIRIFEILEEMQIPCVCVAKNIDWFAITIQDEFFPQMPLYMERLTSEIEEINLMFIRDIKLLVVDEYLFTNRTISMVLRYLELEGLDIMIFRLIKDNRKLMIGVKKEDYSRAYSIVEMALEPN